MAKLGFKCPNKNLQEWKDLVEIQGEQTAHYLWNKFDAIPEQYYKEIYNITSTITPQQSTSLVEATELVMKSISSRINVPLAEVYDKNRIITTSKNIDRESIEYFISTLIGGNVSDLEGDILYQDGKEYSIPNKYTKNLGLTSEDYFLSKVLDKEKDLTTGARVIKDGVKLSIRDSILSKIEEKYNSLVNNLEQSPYVIKEMSDSYIQFAARVAENNGDFSKAQQIRNFTPQQKKDNAELIRNNQIKDLQPWINYLNSRPDYPIEFKYLILSDILKYNVNEVNLKSNYVRLNKRNNTSVNSFESFNARGIASVFEKPTSSNMFLVDYTLELANKAATEAPTEKQFSRTNKGIWYKFINGDAKELSSLVRDTPWCTGSESTAASQLSVGDFYVFVPFNNEENEKIAIKFEGETIAEVRGTLNGQELKDSSTPIVDDFVTTNFPNQTNALNKIAYLKLRGRFIENEELWRDKGLVRELYELSQYNDAYEDDPFLVENENYIFDVVKEILEEVAYNYSPEIERIYSTRVEEYKIRENEDRVYFYLEDGTIVKIDITNKNLYINQRNRNRNNYIESFIYSDKAKRVNLDIDKNTYLGVNLRKGITNLKDIANEATDVDIKYWHNNAVPKIAKEFIVEGQYYEGLKASFRGGKLESSVGKAAHIKILLKVNPDLLNTFKLNNHYKHTIDNDVVNNLSIDALLKIISPKLQGDLEENIIYLDASTLDASTFFKIWDALSIEEKDNITIQNMSPSLYEDISLGIDNINLYYTNNYILTEGQWVGNTYVQEYNTIPLIKNGKVELQDSVYKDIDEEYTKIPRTYTFKNYQLVSAVYDENSDRYSKYFEYFNTKNLSDLEYYEEKYGSLYQKDKDLIRGVFTRLATDKSLILLHKDANITTPLHELAHLWETVLTSDEKSTILNWTKQSTWDRNTSERFAKGFEQYVYEGVKTGDSKVDSLFEKFKTWFTSIIDNFNKYFKGSDLNKDIKAIYNKMLISGNKLNENFSSLQEEQLISIYNELNIFDKEGITNQVEPTKKVDVLAKLKALTDKKKALKETLYPEQDKQDGAPKQIKNLSTLVNHSGGAVGSDTEWDTIGSDFGMVTNRHYYFEERTPRGNVEISEIDSEEGKIEAAKAAKRNFGYKFKTMKDSRLIRNWSQVKYSDAVFAIGKIVDKGEKLFPNQSNDTRTALVPSVTGGTGYAVGMAINQNKPVYVFNQEKSESSNKFISAKGKMTFSYGNNKRDDVKSDTTFEAIQNGERTATTRYESDGHINYWKNLKIGDIVEWEGANGEKQLVEITKPLHKLTGSGKTAEEWSKLEGWSVDYFNSKVKPKLNDAWQIEYKSVSDKKGYDVGWYRWDYASKDFTRTETPILTKNFAGIGTRNINNAGKQAIRDVYSKTTESINGNAASSVSLQLNKLDLSNASTDLLELNYRIKQLARKYDYNYNDRTIQKIWNHIKTNYYKRFAINPELGIVTDSNLSKQDILNSKELLVAAVAKLLESNLDQSTKQVYINQIRQQIIQATSNYDPNFELSATQENIIYVLDSIGVVNYNYNIENTTTIPDIPDILQAEINEWYNRELSNEEIFKYREALEPKIGIPYLIENTQSNYAYEIEQAKFVAGDDDSRGNKVNKWIESLIQSAVDNAKYLALGALQLSLSNADIQSAITFLGISKEAIIRLLTSKQFSEFFKEHALYDDIMELKGTSWETSLYRYARKYNLGIDRENTLGDSINYINAANTNGVVNKNLVNREYVYHMMNILISYSKEYSSLNDSLKATYPIKGRPTQQETQIRTILEGLGLKDMGLEALEDVLDGLEKHINQGNSVYSSRYFKKAMASSGNGLLPKGIVALSFPHVREMLRSHLQFHSIKQMNHLLHSPVIKEFIGELQSQLDTVQVNRTNSGNKVWNAMYNAISNIFLRESYTKESDVFADILDKEDGMFRQIELDSLATPDSITNNQEHFQLFKPKETEEFLSHAASVVREIKKKYPNNPRYRFIYSLDLEGDTIKLRGSEQMMNDERLVAEYKAQFELLPDKLKDMLFKYLLSHRSYGLNYSVDSWFGFMNYKMFKNFNKFLFRAETVPGALLKPEYLMRQISNFVMQHPELVRQFPKTRFWNGDQNVNTILNNTDMSYSSAVMRLPDKLPAFTMVEAGHLETAYESPTINKAKTKLQYLFDMEVEGVESFNSLFKKSLKTKKTLLNRVSDAHSKIVEELDKLEDNEFKKAALGSAFDVNDNISWLSSFIEYKEYGVSPDLFSTLSTFYDNIDGSLSKDIVDLYLSTGVKYVKSINDNIQQTKDELRSIKQKLNNNGAVDITYQGKTQTYDSWYRELQLDIMTEEQIIQDEQLSQTLNDLELLLDDSIIQLNSRKISLENQLSSNIEDRNNLFKYTPQTLYLPQPHFYTLTKYNDSKGNAYKKPIVALYMATPSVLEHEYKGDVPYDPNDFPLVYRRVYNYNADSNINPYFVTVNLFSNQLKGAMFNSRNSGKDFIDVGWKLNRRNQGSMYLDQMLSSLNDDAAYLKSLMESDNRIDDLHCPPNK